jgi:hypothetical protein
MFYGRHAYKIIFLSLFANIAFALIFSSHALASSTGGVINGSDCHTSSLSCDVTWTANADLSDGWIMQIWTSEGASSDVGGGPLQLTKTVNAGSCLGAVLITHAADWSGRIDYDTVTLCARKVAFTTDRAQYAKGEATLYAITNASPNAPILWSSWRDPQGGTNYVSTGEVDANYGHVTDSNGSWTLYGGTWTQNDIGSWRKQAKINGVAANTYFKVVSELSPTPTPVSSTPTPIPTASPTPSPIPTHTPTPVPANSPTPTPSTSLYLTVTPANEYVGDAPLYSIHGAPANTPILWSSWKDPQGGTNYVSTGEADANYGHVTDSTGNASIYDKVWTAAEAGSWKKMAKIGSKTVSVEFTVMLLPGSTMVLNIARNEYKTGEIPLYTINGAPANTPILWSSWRDPQGGTNYVSTGEVDANYGQVTGSGGSWSDYGGAWSGLHIGSWKKQARVGNVTATVEFNIKSDTVTPPLPPPGCTNFAGYASSCAGDLQVAKISSVIDASTSLNIDVKVSMPDMVTVNAIWNKAYYWSASEQRWNEALLIGDTYRDTNCASPAAGCWLTGTASGSINVPASAASNGNIYIATWEYIWDAAEKKWNGPDCTNSSNNCWRLLSYQIACNGAACPSEKPFTQKVGIYHWGGQASNSIGGGIDQIASIGVRNARITMSPRYYTDYNIRSGCYPSFTLAKLAAEPDVRAALANPAIKTMMITTLDGTTFGDCATPHYLNPSFYTPDVASALRKEYSDFVLSLYQVFHGTGKHFIISNWEGDNLVYCDGAYAYATNQQFRDNCGGVGSYQAFSNGNATPDESLQGLRLWFSYRGEGVADGISRALAAGLGGMDVSYAIEFNIVHALRDHGLKSVLYDVLPGLSYDYVSYSSYESINQTNPATVLVSDLNTIQNSVGTKNVIIGEAGFSRTTWGVNSALDRQNSVIGAAMDWGVPFFFHWNLYDQGSGQELDFGVIDPFAKPTEFERLFMDAS